MSDRKLITAVGASGPIARPFVQGFLDQGLRVRILARTPEAVSRMYPAAEVVQGNMMVAADVRKAVAGADGVFLMTPMALLNDPTNEVEAARLVIAALKSAKPTHLIYTSAIGADRLTGVGVLDAKFHNEAQIRDSGLPYSILRCASYMEDLFDVRLDMLRKGRFLLPVRRSQEFCYVNQKDVSRFIAQELLRKDVVLNRAIDFVAPGSYRVAEIEHALSAAARRTIKATPRFPTYHLYQALLPLFRMRRHRFASLIPLVAHWDKHGCVARGESVAVAVPGFRMTGLDAHLRALFRATPG